MHLDPAEHPQALSRQGAVHGRQRLLRPLPRDDALGGGHERGRLAAPGGRHRGARSRRDRRGAGWPAEMVPSRRHVRMNMYIAQAKKGRFEIVESLGAIGPDETMEPAAAEVQPGAIGPDETMEPAAAEVQPGAIAPDETMEPAAAEVQPGTDGVVRPSGRCMR